MMHHKLRILPLLALIAVLLSSCHGVPKHAHYIPKDAFMVFGVHTGEMRNTLAWSAITGSNLLDDLRKGGTNDKKWAAIRDLESSGIDYSSTLYFYARPDTRFADGMKMAAVVPMSDAGKMKSYINSHFPGLRIHDADGRSEILIDGKVYF